VPSLIPDNFTKETPPEPVRQLAEAWLRARLRGAEPDFLDVADGAVIGVYRLPCGLVRRASHSFSRCMAKGCQKPPEVECLWAEGRGRAWHCQKHHDAWVKEDGPDGRDIIKQQKIPDGVVGEKYGEYPAKKTAGDGDEFKKGDRIVYGPLVPPGPRYLPGIVVKPQAPSSLDNPVTIRVKGEGTFETDPDSVTPLSRWKRNPDLGKTAKATGKKTGVGEHVGLFIPLPKDLAKKFPSLGEDDPSPSHVTFLYIGDCKGKRDQKVLVDTLRDACRRWWPGAKATLGGLEYFTHEDKDRRVPHVSVDFDKDLSGFKHRIRQELEENGVEVEDSWPDFKPHVTLGYLPGTDSEWKGKVPKGSWSFDEMEVWGLPKVHKLKLGPSIYKISDTWLRGRLHRYVAARYLVRKIAGWWAIRPGSPGINCPPVDKGGLMNAIPGTDPPDARYNGDGPADIMDAALADVDMEYLMEWGRPATKQELQAVFDFCTGALREDGSRDYGKHEHVNQWFVEFAEWLGKRPNEIRFFQGDSDIVDALRQNWDGTGESLDAYKKEILDLVDKTKKFEGGLEAKDLAERLKARTQVIHDETFRGEDCLEGGEDPEIVIKRVASRYMASIPHGKNVALMKWLSDVTRRLGVARDTYVVGGAVRNFLIGRPIKDLDVVIDSVRAGRDSAWLAAQISRHVPAPTNVTTNQYGVAILTIKGSWVLDGEDMRGEVIEIANARKESYAEGLGKGHKPHTVAPATIEEDVRRRDFTMNALLWRLMDLAHGPEKAEVIDLTGCGRRDLEQGVLRCPQPPDKVFSDDPTRMLRLVRLASKYNLKIPPDVAASVRRNASKLKRMPWEAVATILMQTLEGR